MKKRTAFLLSLLMGVSLILSSSQIVAAKELVFKYSNSSALTAFSSESFSLPDWQWGW